MLLQVKDVQYFNDKIYQINTHTLGAVCALDVFVLSLMSSLTHFGVKS